MSFSNTQAFCNGEGYHSFFCFALFVFEYVSSSPNPDLIKDQNFVSFSTIPFFRSNHLYPQAHFRLLASLYVVCFAFIGISCHTMSYRTIWQPYLVKHRNPLDSVYNPSSLFPWQCSSDIQFKRSADCKCRWKEIHGKGRSILSCCLLSTDLWQWYIMTTVDNHLWWSFEYWCTFVSAQGMGTALWQ